VSRFTRLRRRADHPSDAHARAHARLAERIDGPLGPAESSWLDEHLADCPSCAGVAAAYEDDRVALRALRDESPEPPRDLWARTSAAIEAADSVHRSPVARNRGRALPIGALSGLTVVALVVGVSMLSGSVLFQPAGPRAAATPDVLGASSAPAASAAGAGGPDTVEPTPFTVGAGDVAWVDADPNGGMSLSTVGVDEVCHVGSAAGCPALRDADETALALRGATRTIVGSPTRPQAVAIAKTADAGDALILVSLPERTETPAPSVEPPSSTPPPRATASVGVAASSPPSPSAAIEPSNEPPVAPQLTPEPTVAAEIAIASGIEVVGESAAFSADGTWFAFTARTAAGTGGPDVYAWHVGDERASRLTDDGASYFASWSGNDLIASRPNDVGVSDPGPTSVRIDPATGVETDAGDVWRPAVDPTGRLAVAWDGTLDRGDGDASWAPSQGTLELRGWSEKGAGPGTGPARYRIAADEAAADFDVRWDETGEWVAVWVADPGDQAIGRLTLYRVDVQRARLEIVEGAPVDVPALPGFSIGDGRIAWATPRGQGGEGSRVQIAAWSPSGMGLVESSPGEDIVVIR